MRIIFLVRSLDVGGAERQLVALARGLTLRGHHVSVAVFYGGGAFEEELREDGIPIHHLRKRGRWETIRFLARLARLVRAEHADLLHAYMDANVFAAAVKPFIPGVKVVWGIRSARSDFRQYDRLAVLYPGIERALSSAADAVIVNSMAAARQAIAAGLPAARVVVIPNGIDCVQFRPDPVGRAEVRRRWGIADAEVVVGMVARLDPVKNHANFIRAAATVGARRPRVRFVCVTDTTGSPGYRDGLTRLAAELGLSGRLAWADEGKVTRAVYSALDVAVLSSDTGESFPNVIGEAMACDRACAVTDSGDAAAIVGDTGAVAPPRDPAALALGIAALVDRVVGSSGSASPGARARIEDTFSLALLTTRTEEALEGVLRGRAASRDEHRREPTCAG